MKKVLSLVLVIIMLLGAIPSTMANEAEETVGLNFVTYKIKNGKAIVDWANRDQEGTVIIPDNVNGFPVTEIGEYAFTDCKYITEIVLPDSIEWIYGAAFKNCIRLEKINIPCKSISAPVFQNCQKLKEVVLGEKLSYLHHGVFSDCKIEKLVIKNENITISRKLNELRPEPPVGTFVDTEIGVIYAHKGSDAQKYATEEGIEFVPFEKEITVKVNGEEVECDTAPYIKNDCTMVPMRAIFEALGATVTWDNKTKTAIGKREKTFTLNEAEVKITIGESILYFNGKAFEIDAAAEIVKDRTMVPVRAISEAFNAVVNWEDETKTVEIFVYPGEESDVLRTWFAYDEEGRIAAWATSSGEWMQITYDENGNEIKDRSWQTTVEYTYDENNNCILYEDSLGFKIEYTYDERGNLIKERHYSEKYNSEYVYEFTYNEKGQKITKTDKYGTTMYVYDTNGNLTEEKTADGNGWTKYTYDENNNKIYTERNDGYWEKTAYNESGNPIESEASNGTVIEYVYNENNKLISKSYTAEDYSSNTIYEYDEKSFMVYSENYSKWLSETE